MLPAPLSGAKVSSADPPHSTTTSARKIHYYLAIASTKTVLTPNDLKIPPLFSLPISYTSLYGILPAKTKLLAVPNEQVVAQSQSSPLTPSQSLLPLTPRPIK